MSDDPVHRQQLVDGGHLVFTDDTQRSDLLDGSLTQDVLIELLTDITSKGFHLGITAVRSDHSDDSGLGLHSHANGYCVDCWPTIGPELVYLDVSDPHFVDFLRTAAASPNLYQIGLAGAAWTPALISAAGPTVFQDEGADHIHLGAQ